MGVEHSSLKGSKSPSNTILKSPCKSARQPNEGQNECPTQEFAQKTKMGPNVTAKRRSRSDQNKKPDSKKTVRATKTVLIEAENGTRVSISIDLDEQENLTCEWLVNQARQVLSENNLLIKDENHPLVALQTMDHNITLDYWLTCPKKSVSVLRNGAILKPFYGDNNFKIEKQKVNLKFFHFVKLLGSGGFSKVYLIRRKDNGRLYALKAISKEDINDDDKRQALTNERNVFVRLHHPFLTKMHFAFQTVTHLFFVMDFFPGGDLFYHLNQRRKFSEEEIKIYVGEIILALNYLHKNNIIYRDIKPENILLDIDGHLHLSDFGLCKPLKHKAELNFTFCGSPEYLAPEMIQNIGYGFPVDHYGLGILIYELVVGKAPFQTSGHGDLMNKIVSKKVRFPSGLSANLQSFLTMLLMKNPSKRLGARGGFAEIVGHPWCQDIDLTKIAKKKGKTPITPNLYQTNFDKGFIEREITLEDDASVLYSPEIKGCLELEDGMPIFPKKLIEPTYKDFSFYSNIDDPYDKYLDSVFASEKDESDDLDSIQLTDKLNKSDGEIQEPRDLIYIAAAKSEKPSHPVVPKFKIAISQVCQENFEEEPYDGPLSAKELTIYTTQPIKTIQGSRKSIPFAQLLQTQPSIILNEKVKGKHKTALSYDASATDLKNLAPSTAASSLHLNSTNSISNPTLPKSLNNCKDSYNLKQVDQIPENCIQAEHDSLMLDEFDIDAVHCYSSAKELPKLGGVKKPNSQTLNEGLKV